MIRTSLQMPLAFGLKGQPEKAEQRTVNFQPVLSGVESDRIGAQRYGPILVKALTDNGVDLSGVKRAIYEKNVFRGVYQFDLYGDLIKVKDQIKAIVEEGIEGLPRNIEVNVHIS